MNIGKNRSDTRTEVSDDDDDFTDCYFICVQYKTLLIDSLSAVDCGANEEAPILDITYSSFLLMIFNFFF